MRKSGQSAFGEAHGSAWADHPASILAAHRRTSFAWGTIKGRNMNIYKDDGAITAEYAIATLAGVAFAGLMLLVLRSEEVRAMLFKLVGRALGLEI